MKTDNLFILAYAAKAIWEHEQNDFFEAMMDAKGKGLFNTEAKLVESAFTAGAAAAMRLGLVAKEIPSDEEE